MIIFLDIDGVLNTQSQWKRMYSLDNECIKHFAGLVNKTGASVVLTSSWRSGFVSSMSDENTPQIKDLENRLLSYGVSISGKTPVLAGRSRDKEIERFLYFNPCERFIILDDDKGEFDFSSRHNYFVNSKTGFTALDVRRCLKCF